MVLDPYKDFTKEEIKILCSLGKGPGSGTRDYWAGKSYGERHQHYLDSFGSKDSRRKAGESLRQYNATLPSEVRAEISRKTSETMRKKLEDMSDEEKSEWVGRSFHSEEARKKAAEGISLQIRTLTPEGLEDRMRSSCLQEESIRKRVETQKENFSRMSPEEKFRRYRNSFGSDEALSKLSEGHRRWWAGLSQEEQKDWMDKSLHSEEARKSLRRYYDGVAPEEFSRRTKEIWANMDPQAREDFCRRRGESLGRYLKTLSPEEMEERMRNSCLSGEAVRKAKESYLRKPSGPELFFGIFAEKLFPKRVAYNGCGEQTEKLRELGYSGLKIPDFWVIGKKAVIEVLGGLGWWHMEEEEEDKVSYYGKYGFDCLVLLGYECYLEEAVASKVGKFLNKNTMG